MQLMVFSKHLAGPPLDEVARRLRRMDIRAIDLTVRPGGHVLPERVTDDLPRAVEELGREGVRVGMMTTNITDANDPLTRPILETARQLDIGYYKLGYYPYAGFGTLRRQREEVAAKLRDLDALNAEVGIRGGFHNHSSNTFGASLEDVDYVLQGTDPRNLGSYLDPCHAVIEGGSSGWLMGMDLLADRIIMLAVKDFRWVEGQGYAGARRHKVQICPLEDGNVPWPQALLLLKQAGFDGPVSMHSEYQGSHTFRDLTADEVFEQTARDLRVFRQWLDDAGATAESR